MPPSEESTPSTSGLRGQHAVLALALGLAVSVAAALVVKRDIDADATRHFANRCDQLTLRVQERLGAYALILRGAAGRFSASHPVTRGDWRTYVETLQPERTVPGVQGIGFAEWLPSERLAAHIASVRDEGHPHYEVWPVGARPAYTAIKFLEPFAGRNLRAFGYDMYAEPTRRAAMERARDSGEATLSGPVQLVQETGEDVQTGVLLYLPVYREGSDPTTAAQRRQVLLGWAYSPYRMNDLMRGILGDWMEQEGRAVDLHIADGSARLFDSRPGPPAAGALLQQRRLDFYGRSWQLEFEDARAAAAIDYTAAWATLAAGLMLSGLLYALLRSVIHTRAAAGRIAQRLTEEVRRGADRLREGEAFKAAILDSVLAEIAVLDRDGVIVAVNEPWRRRAEQHGVAPRGSRVGDNYLVACELPEDDPRHGDAILLCEAIRTVLSGRARHLRRELPRLDVGDDGWYALTVAPLRPAGEGAVVSHTDISARKQAEDQLRLAASVFSHAREGIMITDPEGAIVDVNEAFTRITGYGRDEALGRNPRMLRSGLQSPEHYAEFWRRLTTEGHWYGEFWNRHKSGAVYAALQAVSTVRDHQGRARHYVSLFSDITALKAQENRLERIAHYDALTGLPNRVLLADRLHKAMQQAQRRGQLLALVFLDLDGFKAVNDAHGHACGDELLVALARRLQQALRAGDTLARLGGDEFVAVLGDLSSVSAGVPLLARMLDAASQPLAHGDQLLQVTASLGVSFYPQADEVEADQLIRQADQAMYQAKQAGRNRYVVFDAEQDRSLRGHIEGLDRLRAALEAGEFLLHYQPKVNMRSGAVVGAEALIRWQHPTEGLLLPGQFLPLIEHHALSVKVGEWVIDHALAQAEAWQAQGIALPLSLNVGAHQLQQPEFVDRLRASLARHPAVAPGRLQLELLETSELRDLDQVARVIKACGEMGVSFALDDFGTGYSSLTYLKRLAVAQIKVDRSFVRDMLHEPEDLAILEGVMGLARAFDRELVAEGVASVELGQMLLRMGCELGQGHGIARPMPAAELPAWLASWRAPPQWTGMRTLAPAERPLIVASVEHNAWIRAVADHLQGRGPLPADLGDSQCRFSVWLHGEGQALYGEQPGLARVDALHHRVHAVAAQLLALQGHGRTEAAVDGLPALLALRDELQRALWALT
ncbi:PAS domain S-box/diguanylate cyclase (GGDEF) domain-containing protein [Rubrivivax sp. A210]|uniref:EAL domain-containing protein n=1 Tax=Rubrivivax sp. A210 TaxID=2772301 RepID=UPI00191A777C|nr:EAL domain-containing protein [Rubrivivax sp. A210]CAD5374442.1 PAS domain S-box/diguanylate cyclase (GGDEF) domain-containing protein [Rubrivivax sp. A210]